MFSKALNWNNLSDEDIELIQRSSKGDIIKLLGHRYKILRKGSTVISTKRYYWWDSLLDKMFTLED